MDIIISAHHRIDIGAPITVEFDDDGTFTTPDVVGYFGYSWHELYLMGLAAPDEVAPWYYIADSAPPSGSSTRRSHGLPSPERGGTSRSRR